MSKCPTTGLTGVSLTDLEWMSGDWLGKHGADTVEEQNIGARLAAT
ncbi:MAG TPA: hypothetical protein VHL11_03120 [Phototrophicaceae bacterium]|nr:hypothetical protein [Phototrophicaceae bacterium]